MIFIQKFLPFIFKTKNLFLFLFVICLSPSYANDSIVKLRCNLKTEVLEENQKWWKGKMNWDLEVDIANGILVKKNDFSTKNKPFIIKTNFKILSATKNGLVAINEELTSSYVETPEVTTIILDSSKFDSNNPVDLTYATHAQSFGEDYYFNVQYGKCN